MINLEVPTHSITNPAPPSATTCHIWPIADYVVALSLACANSIGTDELDFRKDYICNFIGAPCLVHIDRKSETC